MSAHRFAALAVVLALATSAFGYFGYHRYQARLAAEQEEAARTAHLQVVIQHVTAATLYTTKAMDQVQGAVTVTNGDFDAQTQMNADDLSKRALEIRTTAPAAHKAVARNAAAYVEANEWLLRALLQYQRLQLEVEANSEKGEYLVRVGPHLSRAARIEALQFFEQATATVYALADARRAASDAATNLLAALARVQKTFPADALVEPENVEKLATGYADPPVAKAEAATT